MLGSGAVLAGVACYVEFGQDNSPSSISTGCHLQFERITAIRLAAAWEALFIYDTILFGLTIYKTWRERPRGRIGVSDGRMYMPLLTLVLRDGAVYYAVMALANFVNIMTFYFAGPFLRGSLSTFSSCIAATMMSRLMLNLHRSAPDEGIMSTVSITNMIFNSNATSTDVELDTLNTDDFRIVSTMLSDLPRINSKPDRGHHGVSISNAEAGFSRDPS
ncbi:hypothetical protein L218DRAFT_711440 [Marasmius fiardii PR-910]|nr:hypothetical protein L218DRAFT_711440 [Marasmius fiardii PR-910]